MKDMGLESYNRVEFPRFVHVAFHPEPKPQLADLSERKARLKTLILGPYRSATPEGSTICMSRLERLRTYLKSSGYTNAKLMKDFPDVPKFHEETATHFEVKSKQKILEWPTGLLFVFLRSCDISGVACELTFVDDKKPDLLNSSAVLVEKSLNLSAMVKGPLVRHEIEVNNFETEADLNEFAVGACMKILYRNYWQI